MDPIPVQSDTSLAGVIRQARRGAGLTQHQLASRLATTQSAVSRWEQGHDEPRLATLAALLGACGCRAELRIEDDGVDRAQIGQQLAMTPDQRLASVVNLSRTRAGARRVG